MPTLTPTQRRARRRKARNEILEACNRASDRNVYRMRHIELAACIARRRRLLHPERRVRVLWSASFVGLVAAVRLGLRRFDAWLGGGPEGRMSQDSAS